MSRDAAVPVSVSNCEPVTEQAGRQALGRLTKRAFSRHWTTSWGSVVTTCLCVSPAEASWLSVTCAMVREWGGGIVVVAVADGVEVLVLVMMWVSAVAASPKLPLGQEVVVVVVSSLDWLVAGHEASEGPATPKFGALLRCSDLCSDVNIVLPRSPGVQRSRAPKSWGKAIQCSECSAAALGFTRGVRGKPHLSVPAEASPGSSALTSHAVPFLHIHTSITTTRLCSW